MMYLSNMIRFFALINIGAAIGMIWFWIDFYLELTITKAELMTLIDNFEGYYNWESSLTIPDAVLTLVIIWSSIRLVKSGQDAVGKRMLTAASGAMVLLGGLDLSYALNTNLYQIDHVFVVNLLTAGIGMPVLGVLTILVIHFCDAPEELASQERC